MDGDTDTRQVQDDFKSVVKEHIQYIKENISHSALPNGNVPNGNVPNGNVPNGTMVPNRHAVSNGFIPNGIVSNGHIPTNEDTVLQDLEDEPIESISRGVSHALANGINHLAKQQMAITLPGIANGMVTKKINSLNEDRQNNIRALYGQLNAENHI